MVSKSRQGLHFGRMMYGRKTIVPLGTTYVRSAGSWQSASMKQSGARFMMKARLTLNPEPGTIVGSGQSAAMK